ECYVHASLARARYYFACFLERAALVCLQDLRAKMLCGVQAVRKQVGGVDPGCPRKPCHLNNQQANRPAAEHPDAHTWPEVAEVSGMNGHAKGLEHRSFGIAEGVGE